DPLPHRAGLPRCPLLDAGSHCPPGSHPLVRSPQGPHHRPLDMRGPQSRKGLDALAVCSLGHLLHPRTSARPERVDRRIELPSWQYAIPVISLAQRPIKGVKKWESKLITFAIFVTKKWTQ